MRRSVVVLLACVPVAALAAAAAVAWWPGDLPEPLPTPAEPLLPDLAMSPLTDITAGVAPDGDQYLGFTASIGNVGAGPFIVHAARSDDRGSWRVTQRFRERRSTTSEISTPADMSFGGHGHDHWHLQVGASYRLTRPGSEVTLRRYAKVGYCFFDQAMLVVAPPETPPAPEFGKRACDGRKVLELEMGLSPGYADPYLWTLPDQRLLVTGLDDGVYRLWADADPTGLFRESDEANNDTWIDVRLTLSSRPPRAVVVRRGPAGGSRWVG